MAGKQHRANGPAAPRRPQRAKGAKSGVKPGSTPTTPAKNGGKRPVEEEDVFGGAERVHDRRVSSDKAKP